MMKTSIRGLFLATVTVIASVGRAEADDGPTGADDSAVTCMKSGAADACDDAGLQAFVAKDHQNSLKFYRRGCLATPTPGSNCSAAAYRLGEDCVALAERAVAADGNALAYLSCQQDVLSLFERGCGLDDFGACVSASRSRQRGLIDGSGKDPAKAAEHASRACRALVSDAGRVPFGPSLGCEILASMTEKGEGVPQDAAAAISLYRKACTFGASANACRKIGDDARACQIGGTDGGPACAVLCAQGKKEFCNKAPPTPKTTAATTDRKAPTNADAEFNGLLATCRSQADAVVVFKKTATAAQTRQDIPGMQTAAAKMQTATQEWANTHNRAQAYVMTAAPFGSPAHQALMAKLTASCKINPR